MKQHEIALARANEVRVRRANLKREIKLGDVDLPELLANPALPKWLEGESTARLICALHRYGSDRAASLCVELQIPELTPIGKLTYRKRRELADELARRSAPRKPEPSGRRAVPRVHGTSQFVKRGRSKGRIG